MIDIPYNPKTRSYEWTPPGTDTLVSFGRGPQAKQDATHFAIGMLYPELEQMARDLLSADPQLSRVMWRGVELVIADAVTLFDTPTNGVVALVNSQSGIGRYAITRPEDYPTCQCPHWQQLDAPLAANGWRVCKHVAAYLLQEAVR